ncbi:uncharacterized protein TEOVI_000832500 [Trypanosoma equiperdum]|uniref:Variant surface glycoprotein (VSG) n=1 Tax=Trypanosoma equiperdum TaxID=5694 RepID=A0A1G4I352_TRYEQ|nr:hypothetical protein TEOVI_000832500 [Trypanosoma equiperdum]
MIFKRSGYPSAERLKAVALTAAVISLATRTAQTTGVEPASKKVNNLCRESKYTRHLADHILRNSEPPTTQLANLQTYADAWELLAHTNTATKLKAAAYALASKAKSEHNTAGATAMQKRKAATEAADILTKRSQAAKRLLGMALELKTGTAAVEATAVGDNTPQKVCEHTVQPVMTEAEACTDTPAANMEPESVPVELNAKTKIKLLKATDLRPRPMKTAVGGNTPQKVCELTVQPVMTGAEACIDTPTANTEPESVPVDLNAKTKIKLLKATDLRPRPMKVAAEAKGTITNIDGADGYGCRQGSDANNHFIRLISKATAAEADKTAADVPIDKLNGASEGCGSLEARESRSELDNKLIGQKICEYINTPTAAVTDPTAWDPEQRRKRQQQRRMSQ